MKKSLVFILLLLVSMALPAGGCGDPAFTRYAVAQAGESLKQANVALDECRRDLAVDRQRETDLQWQAYVADQADTLAKAIKENPSPEAAKAALKTLSEKFRNERLAVVELNRQRTDLRFRLAEEHFAFTAQILAKLDALARSEESVQAQLQHYQDLAEQIAREKFGIPPDLVAPATPAPPAVEPAVTAPPAN